MDRGGETSGMDDLVAGLGVAGGAPAPDDDDNEAMFSLSSILITLLSAYVLYYLLFVVKKPSLHCNDGLKHLLWKRCPILLETYWPTIWCLEARFQTILCSLLQSFPNVKFEREILELSDGGILGLDWAVDDDDVDDDDDDTKKSVVEPDTRPVIVILPGLTGSSQAAYVQHLVKECHRLRYRSVVMNYRGIGGVPVKIPRTYCAARSEDLGEVIDSVRGKYPLSPVMAVGISLGGIILTNYLAKKGGASGLVAGMTVSSPFNLSISSQSLSEGLNKYLFNQYLCNCLKKTVKPHEDLFKDMCDMKHVYESRIISEFDARFTVRVFGYKDLDDYYTDGTTENKLHRIEVPLLCLNADDDAFYPGKYLPRDEAQLGSNVMQVVTPRGGHLAFFEGCVFPKGMGGYIQRLFSQFSDAIINHAHEIGSSSSSAQPPVHQPISNGHSNGELIPEKRSTNHH